MGRKSKLTDKQWQEVDRRLLEGDKPAHIAKDFPVSEAAIRARKTASAEKIKSVANQIVATENALKALPIAAQITAQTFAAKLRALSSHMLEAATYSAATAHRVLAIAHSKAQELDDVAPLDGLSGEALRVVSALTAIGNDSAKLGAAILTGSKEAVKEANAGAGEGDKAALLAEIEAKLPN